ncbi:MAG: hypothetical protein M0Z39_08950 [Actinomycetota bacterium]|jgi:hypothetical protein|nr:hypothetical protein [Actinomycetota bacterium]
MSYRSVLPAKLVWLVAGVMAMLSVSVVLSGYGVERGGSVAVISQSVDILPTPVTSTTQPRSANSSRGASGTLDLGKLIEIASSSPVLNYSESSRRLTEVSSAGSTAREDSNSSDATPPPVISAVKTEEQSVKLPASGTAEGSDAANSASTNSSEQTLAKPDSPSASTTTTSTTSTTLAKSDGGDSKGGGDN